jgi:hypothetical protein
MPARRTGKSWEVGNPPIWSRSKAIMDGWPTSQNPYWSPTVRALSPSGASSPTCSGHGMDVMSPMNPRDSEFFRFEQ